MNNLDENYKDLLREILSKESKSNNRTGTNSISVFGRQIRHNMKEGFPLLTTKKMYWKGIVTELLWFLKGDTNIKYLIDNNCHIWDGDAYKAFEEWKQETDAKIRKNNPTIDFQPLEYESKEEFVNKIKTDSDFAKKWGDLGPIYGKQWRKWEKYGFRGVQNGAEDCGFETQSPYIDQITNSLNLLKTDPDSRRNKVSAWNVSDLSEMTLPPCHTDFQFHTRELALEERLAFLDQDNVQDIIESYKENIENINGYTEYLQSHCNTSKIPKRAISLMWNQRSIDVPLGLPFNIASYGLLLEIFGRMVNMVPEELICTLGNTHVYEDQIPGIQEQLIRESFPLPNLEFSDLLNFNGTIDDFLNTCDNTLIKIVNYQSHPPIPIPLSN